MSGWVSDSAPALAYHSGQIALAWSRYTRSMTQSVVRLAASPGGAWNASTLSWGGIKNEAPDLCYDGDTLHAVWVHIGTVAHAEGRPGAMTAHTVPSAHVTGAKVAASNGRVFIGWSVRTAAETPDGSRSAPTGCGPWLPC